MPYTIRGGLDKCLRGSYKRRFETREEAEEQLAKIHEANNKRVKGRKTKNIPQRAYYCKYCSGFHLTSQQTTKRGLGV